MRRTRRVSVVRGADALVFLCSGNMVRSAFAELYARHLGCPTRVLSAATLYRNSGIYPETARALSKLGVDETAIRSFQPTHVEDLIPRLARSSVTAPVFLCMRRHHADAMDAWPEHRVRTFLLDGDGEIGDPVLEGADFAETFARVGECVRELVRELE